MQCEVATFTPYKNLTETRENNLQSRPQAEICTGSSNWKKRSNARTGLQRYDHVIQSLPRILNRRNNVGVDGVDKVSAALHCTHIRKSFAAVLNECVISVYAVTAAQITRQVKRAVLFHPVSCVTLRLTQTPQSYRNTSHQTTISRYKTTAHRQVCGNSITTASHW